MIKSLREELFKALNAKEIKDTRDLMAKENVHSLFVKESDLNPLFVSTMQKIVRKMNRDKGNISRTPDETAPANLPWDSAIAKATVKALLRSGSIGIAGERYRQAIKNAEKNENVTSALGDGGLLDGKPLTPNKSKAFVTYTKKGSDGLKVTLTRGYFARYTSKKVIKRTSGENEMILTKIISTANYFYMYEVMKIALQNYIDAVSGHGGYKSFTTGKDRSKYNFAFRGRGRQITHGKTKLDAEGNAVVKTYKGTSTTVAAVTYATKMDGAVKSIMNKEKNSITRTAVGERLFKEYEEILEKEYKLSYLRNSKGGINRKLTVNVEVGGYNPAMAKYDKSGIEAFLKKHDKELAEKLGKQLALDFAMLEGSPSIVADISNVAPHLIMDKLTKSGKLDKRKKGITKSGGLDMRITANKNLVKAYQEALRSTKTSGSLKEKGSVKQTTKKSRAARVGLASFGSQPYRSRVDSAVGENPLALATLINKALPKVVASKMTSPALNYRTGRFANSAEVENVTMGPRGGTEVQYTYMKYPYQTFEPGFAQGSTYRDPRKIIGESIREIAQGILGNKFLSTRRV